MFLPNPTAGYHGFNGYQPDINAFCTLDIMSCHPWGNRAKLFAHGKKNGYVTATKLGTTNKYFVAATKNFAAATKRFVDRTKHFVVVTKCFCYPYFNK